MFRDVKKDLLVRNKSSVIVADMISHQNTRKTLRNSRVDLSKEYIKNLEGSKRTNKAFCPTNWYAKLIPCFKYRRGQTSRRKMVSNYTKLLIFIFLTTIKYELSKAQERWLYNFSEYNKALFGFVITSINVDQLSSCITMCERNNNCASINFDMTTLICELNRSTKRAYPEKIGDRGNTMYMEIRARGQGKNTWYIH